ncbi:MAG: hypothetical protein WBM13_02890 [Bacteroidia bacterium]
MSNFKEKAQVFIMGLMTGLIIAGAFFILKLDTYFKELNFYKGIVKTLTFKSENKTADNNVVEEEATTKDTKNKTNSIKTKNTISNDSASKTNNNTFELTADTLTKFQQKDTIVSATASLNEDIVIRKDELLLTKTVEIINISGATNSNNAKDSLLQHVSGIKEDKATKQLVNVELWQSPLNYKGYKMGKYKIVLYGIASIEGLKVYAVGNDMYLKAGNTVYNLENTSEFKPYEKVTNEAIISKLK